MKIGILSDTHGVVHPKVFEFFKDCDEIWHAGDIGSEDVLIELAAITKVRAVWGNIDTIEMHSRCKEIEVFECEGHKVFLKHIVGTFPRYDREVLPIIEKEKPTLVVLGHSHILQIMNDEKHNWLFMNPGAAGQFGPHTHITFIRFDIKDKNISNLEIYDEPK